MADHIRADHTPLVQLALQASSVNAQESSVSAPLPLWPSLPSSGRLQYRHLHFQALLAMLAFGLPLPWQAFPFLLDPSGLSAGPHCSANNLSAFCFSRTSWFLDSLVLIISNNSAVRWELEARFSKTLNCFSWSNPCSRTTWFISWMPQRIPAITSLVDSFMIREVLPLSHCGIALLSMLFPLNSQLTASRIPRSPSTDFRFRLCTASLAVSNFPISWIMLDNSSTIWGNFSSGASRRPWRPSRNPETCLWNSAVSFPWAMKLWMRSKIFNSSLMPRVGVDFTGSFGGSWSILASRFLFSLAQVKASQRPSVRFAPSMSPSARVSSLHVCQPRLHSWRGSLSPRFSGVRPLRTSMLGPSRASSSDSRIMRSASNSRTSSSSISFSLAGSRSPSSAMEVGAASEGITVSSSALQRQPQLVPHQLSLLPFHGGFPLQLVLWTKHFHLCCGHFHHSPFEPKWDVPHCNTPKVQHCRFPGSYHQSSSTWESDLLGLFVQTNGVPSFYLNHSIQDSIAILSNTYMSCITLNIQTATETDITSTRTSMQSGPGEPVYLTSQDNSRFAKKLVQGIVAKQSSTSDLGIQRIPRSILLRREWFDQNPHVEKQNDQSHSRSKTFRFKLPKNSSNQVSSVLVSLMQRDFRKQQKWIPTLKHKSENINTESKNKSENSEPKLLKNPFKILTKTQFMQLPEKIKLVEETVIFPPHRPKATWGIWGRPCHILRPSR